MENKYLLCLLGCFFFVVVIIVIIYLFINNSTMDSSTTQDDSSTTKHDSSTTKHDSSTTQQNSTTTINCCQPKNNNTKYKITCNNNSYKEICIKRMKETPPQLVCSWNC